MRKKKINKTKLYLILFFGFLITYMTCIEPNLMIEKHKKLYLPNWNQSLNGLKVGVVSDMHIGTNYVDLERVERITERINRQNPDIILILGDFDTLAIAETDYSEKDISDVIKKFKSKYGTVAILGNHDYYPSALIRGILQDAGVKLLENSDCYITHNNTQFRIVGFKDIWHYTIVPSEIVGEVKESTLVLSHNPDTFPKIPQEVSLTLSGHTHGGEIYLPIIGSPMVPSKYHERYRKGYIVENNKHLLVTSGVATLSHLRLCNPPEIIFLELYQQTKSTKVSNTKRLTGKIKNLIPYYYKVFSFLTSK